MKINVKLEKNIEIYIPNVVQFILVVLFIAPLSMKTGYVQKLSI